MSDNDQIMVPLNLYRLLFSALLLAGIALFTGQASATAIPIANFSFESPPATSPRTFGCPTSWVCSNPTIEGVYTPTTTQYPPPNGLGSGFVPDGTQAAFMAGNANNQSFTQNTTATFVAGQIYTLSAWAGFRIDDNATWGPNNIIELLANNVATPAMQFTVPSPTRGDWALATLTYTALAADNGKLIGVGLLGATNGNNQAEVNWDNVTLNVPEPSILLLLGMGFGALALARRKRKNLA